MASIVTNAPEMSRICRNFGIAVISLLLASTPQADVIGSGPGADHVNRCVAAGGIEAAAERLAVDGNHLPAGEIVQRCDPTQKTLLELRRLDGGRNRVEAVVRGNA
jgi:hypothetical protein